MKAVSDFYFHPDLNPYQQHGLQIYLQTTKSDRTIANPVASYSRVGLKLRVTLNVRLWGASGATLEKLLQDAMRSPMVAFTAIIYGHSGYNCKKNLV